MLLTTKLSVAGPVSGLRNVLPKPDNRVAAEKDRHGGMQDMLRAAGASAVMTITAPAARAATVMADHALGRSTMRHEARQ